MITMTITIFIQVDVKANRIGESERVRDREGGKQNISYLDSNFRLEN